MMRAVAVRLVSSCGGALFNVIEWARNLKDVPLTSDRQRDAVKNRHVMSASLVTHGKTGDPTIDEEV